jgi:YidC/Oxa1 family membrane protein insertase
MDTKRLILSVTLMLGLLLGWRLLMNHLYTLHPSWDPNWKAPEAVVATQPAPPPTTQVAMAAATTGPTSGPVVASATQPTAPIVQAPTGLHAISGSSADNARLGTAAKNRMLLNLDPRGAGLDAATLVDFNATADPLSPRYQFEKPIDGFESITRPMATRSVTIDGRELDLSNCVWKQSEPSVDSMSYTVVVNDGVTPVLEITKTFKLQPRDAAEGSGFEVAFNQTFRNLSGKSIKVKTTFNGPTPPARENDRSEDRRYITGYDDVRSIDTGSAAVGDFNKGKPAKDLITTDTRPMLWIGACSSYFESIYQPDVSGKSGIKLANALVSPIDPGEVKLPDQFKDDPTQLAISTGEFTLSAGGTDTLDSRVFFGPKERSLLKDSYYSAFPRMYDATLLYKSGPCGYITFTWLINVLYGILWFFHKIFQDWGIAIICLVALVRTLLHPITKKSQINMVEMSKKAPEMERLKKKFADDKEALVRAQAELMNPAGMLLGCLPMFLQTPIWIALWSALQSTFELRQAGFLRFGHVHLTWISDLSHPDALFTFAHPITLPLLFFHPEISSINILPLFLAVVFFVQQQMQPAPPNMTPEQEQQRKMMKWMSLLFPIMLYSGPSGLTLYILTSTTIGIIESKIIRDHIKQRDEAEKAGRIIVDAAPTRGNRKRRDGDDPGSLANRGKAPPKPLTGWRKLFAELMEKAEQAKREAERRGSK